ncbi:MAG: hypothetical protein NT096_06420 [Proteobacteria bacterium]|nr:hypothetical protein [Pseudomonadota bacterium]
MPGPLIKSREEEPVSSSGSREVCFHELHALQKNISCNEMFPYHHHILVDTQIPSSYTPLIKEEALIHVSARERDEHEENTSPVIRSFIHVLFL